MEGNNAPRLDRIYTGGALSVLKSWPDGCIDMCMCSPPYWASRDYQTTPLAWAGDPACRHSWSEEATVKTGGYTLSKKQASNRGSRQWVAQEHASMGAFCQKCGAWRGDLGLEPNPDMFVDHLLEVFDEVHRVLKSTGTCWINLGDTYSGRWGNYAPNGNQGIQRARNEDGKGWSRRAYEDTVFKPPSSTSLRVQKKSLCLIPERFALGMVERGWLLRNKIVWHKPNHMPSSVKDRLACSWEHLFFFVKSRKYHFDLDAIRVPHAYEARPRRPKPRRDIPGTGGRLPPNPGEPQSMHPMGKNPSDYWAIAPEHRSFKALTGRKTRERSWIEGKLERYARRIEDSGSLTRREKKRALAALEDEIARIRDGSSADFRLIVRGNRASHPGAPGQSVRARELHDRGFYFLRCHPNGSNPGDCWDLHTKPFPGAHFAVYPERLCEPPIRAGCPSSVCVRCGIPSLTQTSGGSGAFNIRVRDVQKGKLKHRDRQASKSEVSAYSEKNYRSTSRTRRVLGCTCDAGFSAGIVLDPFAGAGTTLAVAKRLGRHFVGIEINREYVRLARQRLRTVAWGMPA